MTINSRKLPSTLYWLAQEKKKCPVEGSEWWNMRQFGGLRGWPLWPAAGLTEKASAAKLWWQVHMKTCRVGAVATSGHWKKTRSLITTLSMAARPAAVLPRGYNLDATILNTLCWAGLWHSPRASPWLPPLKCNKLANPIPNLNPNH